MGRLKPRILRFDEMGGEFGIDGNESGDKG